VCSVAGLVADGSTKFRERQPGVIVATQLPARADAAPFVGPAAGAALGTPTVTGVTPAAVRSGRVYVCRGGWRAAVRSAWKWAAQLSVRLLGALDKLTCRHDRKNGW
jgi:hypothetical protein